MQKIINEKYQETRYEKTLANGLKVVIFHNPEYVNNFFSLMVKYGANDFKQIDEQGNKYHLPSGVAHFLEHRMFDYQGQEVMDLFNSMGASSNASTGFEQTQYYFHTSENYLKPLGLLLDFVQDLTIPEASVEKEKGIIIEELKMYDNNPDFSLYFKTLENLYVELPYNHDLGGSPESVSITTLENLYSAYHMNYHPHNMILVGVVNGDIETVFNFIEDNQKKKTFAPYHPLKRDYPTEPAQVNIERRVKQMDVSTNKISIAYKFLHKETDQQVINRQIWSLVLFMEMIFSSVNEEYQSWIDQRIINDYFGHDIALEALVGHIILQNETDDEAGFVEFIEQILANKDKYMDEQKFMQLQRRYIGKSIKAYEKPAALVQAFGRSYLEGADMFKSLDDLAEITYAEMREVVGNLFKTEHRTIYKIEKIDDTNNLE